MTLRAMVRGLGNEYRQRRVTSGCKGSKVERKRLGWRGLPGWLRERVCRCVVPSKSIGDTAEEPSYPFKDDSPKFKLVISRDMSLKGRSFLTLLDFEKEDIRGLLDLAHKLKASGPGDRLRNKHLVLLFEKRSTRTRCAFEIAMKDEGGHVTYLDKDSSQFSKKESVEDSAKILGSYYHAIEYRGFDQSILEKLAKYSGVPVYNGLTDVDHPTQILADIMTIEEHVKKPLSDVRVAFVGDTRNNMAIAWMYGCAKMGMHYIGYGPKELRPTEDITRKVTELCKKSGGSIKLSDAAEDLIGADVLYTDVWVSMGEEDQMKERVRLLSRFRVTMDVIRSTKNPNVKFMHCLPAFHDLETEVARKAMEELKIDVREVTDEVFRSHHSIAFPEAVNRIHTIRAVLVATLGRE